MKENKETPKKTVVFSSTPMRRFIESMVADQGIVDNRNPSAVIEHVLLEKYLPENKNVQYWVKTYLYGENGSIQRTLSVAFDWNAVGTNWKSVHDNFLPLVLYLYNMELIGETFALKEETYSYICRQMDSVVKRFESKEDNADFIDAVERSRNIYCGLCEQPVNVARRTMYELLIDYWDDLKGWTITYRLLSSLVKTKSGWNDTPENRIELMAVLKQIGNGWEIC